MANQVVGATTEFQFDLVISESLIEAGDYLDITLPSDYGIEFETGSPSCSIDSMQVSGCIVVSSKQAQIVFGASTSQTFLAGRISNFKNPESNRAQQNIQILIYGSDGLSKTSVYIGTLSSFVVSSVSASLSSSSSVVGDTGETLTVSVTPSTLMLAQGGLVIFFPEYYEDASSNQMISVSNPACSGTDMFVSRCEFNTAFRQLTLLYALDSGTDTTSTLTFTIGSFQNPVKPGDQSGFVVITTDELGYSIGESATLSLSGVTAANTFSYITFSFDDNGRVG